MAFPALLKSPYALGTAGVVGVGGVSVAAWSGSGDGIDHSEFLKSEEKVQARHDLIKRFVTGDWLKNDRCFAELFPNIKVSLQTPTFGVSDKSFTTQSPTSVLSEPSSTKGCAFVQHSRLDAKAFIFQMEITVRNDNVGLALWIAGSNVDADLHSSKIKPKNSKHIRYYLAFMEKAGDEWDTKGGYSWYDNQFVYESSAQTLNVNIDGKSMYPRINKFVGITSEMTYKDEEWKHGVYFGHWNVGGSYGKEVFEGIEIWKDNKNAAEILGKDYSKTFEESKDSKGYADFSKYKVVDRYEYVKPKTGEANVTEGWHFRKEIPASAASALDNWYAPFKGIKGTWAAQPIPQS